MSKIKKICDYKTFHPGMQIIENDIKQALREIISGKTVKRGKHELNWNEKNIKEMFVEELRNARFQPTRVKDIQIKPGERIPAFLIRGDTAYFGWVFYEKFSSEWMRKLWGSVIRNAKGDWAIQLTPQKKEIIYANADNKEYMELDYPPEF